jgi:prepilin-type processing-associated H-X9-DG protein
MNSFLCDPNSTDSNGNVLGGINGVAVVEPANTVVFHDTNYYHSYPSRRDQNGNIVATLQLKGDPRGYNWSGYGDDFRSNGAGCSTADLSTAAGMKDCITQQSARHSAQVNCAYFDGHSKSMTIERLDYDYVQNKEKSFWDPYKAGFVAP